MKILIKSAVIIDQDSSFHQKKVDILIHNGKIVNLAKYIKEEVDREISFKNLHVSPGWFDSSVSFGEPGYEERETLENGLRTAALSGFTALALNPVTKPVTDTHAAIAYLKHRAEKNAIHLFPIGALTHQSEGIDLAELYDMHQAGAVAFGDFKSSVRNPNLLKIALQYVQNFDGLVESFPQENKIARNGLVHESPNSTMLGLSGIPSFAEEMQIARDLYILEYTGGKLHIPTISTEIAVKLIKAAKKKGLDVSCSVALHNLYFTDEKLENFNTNAKVTPPLRGKKDRQALLKAVKDGTIDMVTTDHFPIDIEQKKVEFENAAFGSIGLESAFGVLNKLMKTEKAIELLTAGRKRFGLNIPKIEEGEVAELSFFDPTPTYSFEKENIHSTSKNSIFLHEKLTGKALGIYSKKKLIIENGK